MSANPLSIIDSFSEIQIEPSLREGFMLEEILVCPNKGAIVREQDHHHVSPKAMELLFILSCNSGKIISRQAISAYIWGDSRKPSSSLGSLITELRRLLNDHTECPIFIQTLPRKGYRLLVPALPVNESLLSTDALRKTLELNGTKKNRKAFGLLGNARYWHNSRMLKVAGTYVVMSWVLMQVVSVALPVINAAKWFDKVALISIIIGLPLVLSYNWWTEYRLRQYFLRKNNTLTHAKEISSHAYRDLCYISIVSVCSLTLSFFLGNQVVEAAKAPTINVTQPSIKAEFFKNAVAVMPFRYTGNMSSNISKGVFQSEVSAFLSRSTYIKVVSERVLSSLPENTSLQTIRDWTGAKYIIEGSINQQGDTLQIIMTLVDTESGYQLWSKKNNVPITDKLSLVGSISQQVYNALTFLIPNEETSVLKFKPTDDINAYDYYVRAKALFKDAYNEEQFKKAEDLFIKAIGIDSQFTLAQAGLCQTYLQHYNLTKVAQIFEFAKQSCKQSNNEKGNEAESYIALGSLYSFSGEYLLAEQYFSQALLIQPNNSSGLMGIAETLAKLNKMTQAEQFFLKGINVEPGYWKSYEGYGNFLFGTGRYFDASVQYYKQSLLQPNSEEAFNNLGAAYYMDSEFDKATDSWRKALDISPSANAYSNLGTSLFYARRFTQAIDMYKEAVNLKPTDFIVMGNLADAFKYAGNLEMTAKQFYQEAIKQASVSQQIDPKDITIKASIARYRSELGLCAQAKKEIQLIQKTEVNDPYIYYDFALVENNCGSTDNIIMFLQKALSSGYPSKLLLSDHQFTKYRKQISRLQ
ncbi:MAG: tetratricopeptide (TPR) repeat protein/DNA-binding winged helix-turn-helix (wHTH) protein [Glaciecola sp.]|jgi:tetratricopeptide (TPR) repeat protein/DNA-binding winged helix-turn-helix (wHTH) protein/TolB-like protein